MPNAAVIQISAAVVRPFTETPSLKITPAPIKPIPVTIYHSTKSGGLAAKFTLYTQNSSQNKSDRNLCGLLQIDLNIHDKIE